MNQIKIRVIRFDVKTDKEQKSLTENTHFEIVGPYLVYRNTSTNIIRVATLPFGDDGFLKIGKENSVCIR